MKYKFIWHADPGHEWLEVRHDLIQALGIENLISKYSYISRDGSLVYLEGDCDAEPLLEVLKNKGAEVETSVREWSNLCPIRTMRRYRGAV